VERQAARSIRKVSGCPTFALVPPTTSAGLAQMHPICVMRPQRLSDDMVQLVLYMGVRFEAKSNSE